MKSTIAVLPPVQYRKHVVTVTKYEKVAAPDELELTEEELDQVAGGLARAWDVDVRADQSPFGAFDG